MKWLFEDKINQGKFIISCGDPNLDGRGRLNGGKEILSSIVFNPGPVQTVTIDKISYDLPNNAILPLVANQIFSFEVPENLVAWQFNREFYCMVDHDVEVGCVGFLFYGIQHPFFIHLSDQDRNVVSSIQSLCIEDMHNEDRMQGEMLRTMLKRLIIYITRIAKQQTGNYQKQPANRMDAIRQFNLLLERNFRSRHDVRFYAESMNKSPKTLTNLFALCNYPPPSELIRQRILLEAKRYLYFTDKSAKEVAGDLGFANVAHFSRFFKSGTGRNFSEYNALV